MASVLGMRTRRRRTASITTSINYGDIIVCGNQHVGRCRGVRVWCRQVSTNGLLQARNRKRAVQGKLSPNNQDTNTAGVRNVFGKLRMHPKEDPQSNNRPGGSLQTR